MPNSDEVSAVHAPPSGWDFQPSAEVWYEDGSIILVAENEGFRVYSGILSQQSSIFADMFSMPRPIQPQPQDIYQGCPVVHLPDSALEMRCFLKVLHDAR